MHTRIIAFGLCIFIWFISTAAAQGVDLSTEQTFTIESIEPQPLVMSPNPPPVIAIHGKNLDQAETARFITEKYDDALKKFVVTTIPAQIEKKENQIILVKVPNELKQQICTAVQLSSKNDAVSAVKKVIVLRDVVYEAIKMKQSGSFQEPFIIDHLFHARKADEYDNVFGNIKLTADEMSVLNSVKFSDDFIAKMEGQPQYVTIGMAGIWLNETAELVAAPMIRIFLTPRSYYSPRKPLIESFGIFKLPTGFRFVDKWDLNVGYTASASTQKNGDPAKEQKNYVLIGLSYEINRSALFNIGMAYVPGDVKGVQKQVYFGFTLDQNILKQVGLLGN